MGILDHLYPKYCVYCKKLGSYLCPNCFSRLSFDVKKMCIPCNRPSFNGLTHPGCEGRYVINGTFCAVSYNSVTKKLLYQFKYKPYLSDLQKFIVELMYESFIQNEEFNKVLNKDPIITFVPLHSSKLKERGYNQVEYLAFGLSKKFGLKVQQLLVRTIKTKPQFGLKKEERKENVKGAFMLNKVFNNLKNQTIFLVDDVLTTGSTLLECSNILKRGGAREVYGITFAID